jgi:hypothetical protein
MGRFVMVPMVVIVVISGYYTALYSFFYLSSAYIMGYYSSGNIAARSTQLREGFRDAKP